MIINTHKYRVSSLVLCNGVSYQQFFIKGLKIKISYETCVKLYHCFVVIF